MTNSLTSAIKQVLHLAAALEREPVQPGENEVTDRAERRRTLQARFDALLVEACAPGYNGAQVITDAPRFKLVSETQRNALREADEAARGGTSAVVAMAFW